ncbi:MAG: pilin [Minisyncoccia bacterium]
MKLFKYLLFLFFLIFLFEVKQIAAVTIKSPIQATSIEQIANNILNYIFWLGVILAPVMIVWGGLNILFASGDPNKVRQGTEIIKWTIIGFAVILFSRGIMALIEQIIK